MAAGPTLVDQAIALMTEGVRTGNVPPKVLMESVPAQIAAQIVEQPAQRPFYRQFKKLPDAVQEADRNAMPAHAQRQNIANIVPPYRKPQTSPNANYLPTVNNGLPLPYL